MKILTRVFGLALLFNVSMSSCIYVGGPGGNGFPNSGMSCMPINQQEHQRILAMMDDRMMSNDKLSTAKQQTQRAGCLSAQQISAMVGKLMMEDQRLDLAKFAYTYCADKKNYGIMNTHFMMDKSKRELGAITGVN